MLGSIIKSIFGSKNERELKRLWPLVKQINELEAALQSQPAEALRDPARFEQDAHGALAASSRRRTADGSRPAGR